jgi:hypothetical protein
MKDAAMRGFEQARLEDDGASWKRWGPYLAERAWGTVREDYSPHGDAWAYLPHDHARSRAYRWNEDGLAGVCDHLQRLCFALAFWNGADPILKERIFGLAGNEGNHGEDAKELWWYLDSTPTHSWMQWAYLYPQREYPYERLVHENRSRSRQDPEFELLDTGIFDDDRYWDITVDYAKASADDLCIRIRVRNAGPDDATLHVLPTLWFRNTWSWGLDDRKPLVVDKDGALVAEHSDLGRMVLTAGGDAERLFCDNESNARRLWDVEGPKYPKDGIADHVVHGSPTIDPARRGTKAAFWFRLPVPAGATEELRLRLSSDGATVNAEWHETMADRQHEADEFYAAITPEGVTDDEGRVLRQSLAGMLWTKQFFHFDVDRWLEGDPAFPSPPASRASGRNHEWRHLNNADVISMPDKWEYPWYAAWDLAFHCVPLALVDASFAKDQLILLCREWYMHPNGQLPAYEWSFSDVNPPVHAWAALRVFEIDGARDHDFLQRVFQKLLLNFTWWVNRKDAAGMNVFEGGFLGLDNIGPIDRSAQLPVAGRLVQSDGTAWMAMYCLNMLEMALVLAERDPVYEDMATKFLEHFAYIATASEALWDEDDGFYHDVLYQPDGGRVPLRVGSVVGLLPLAATTTLSATTLDRLPDFATRTHWFVANKAQFASGIARLHTRDGVQGRLLSVVPPERLARLLAVMLDEAEFLSPHGVRALSARHRDEPFTVDLAGIRYTVDYEPAESTTDLFGGNSNWRGPVWFPVNYLLVEGVQRFADFYGDDVRVECPKGSGRDVTLGAIVDELTHRLVGAFLDGPDGRRPAFGSAHKLQTDPTLHNRLLFHEYFHGDTGAGLGASHQTGWTGLVANLIHRRAMITRV